MMKQNGTEQTSHEGELVNDVMTKDIDVTEELWSSDVQVLYKVDETPPWSLTILFAFQV